MPVNNLLCDKFQILFEQVIDEIEISSYIKDNINPKFKLRQYQIEAHYS